MNEALFIPEDCFSIGGMYPLNKIKRLVIIGTLQKGKLYKDMKATINGKEVIVIGIEIHNKMSNELIVGEKAGVMVEELTKDDYTNHIKQFRKDGITPTMRFYE